MPQPNTGIIQSWLKNVSAFANTLGGLLFFGVDNDGNVKGLEDIQHVTVTLCWQT
jgi:ATP-dependent DNA helicase RecG